ncbi:hypothetical protein BC831DRAFT_447540 [Entophlyctis helioformis]|nr:hypothetical protein BC831DRAFT_447540 [Entophlyctis helioformis]
MLFDSASADAAPLARPRGLGAFGVMDDHLLLEFLASASLHSLSSSSSSSTATTTTTGASAGDVALCRLAQTSRAFYCFAYDEGLWRQRTIAHFGGAFVFQGTWRNTFKWCTLRSSASASTAAYVPDVYIRVPRMYSDVLYTAWRCTSVPLDDLCGVHVDNIDRRSGLSKADFIREYGVPNLPVILTDVVPQWPAYGKWNTEYFVSRYGDRTFRAEAVDIAFGDYVHYMAKAKEESPLYLFDKRFAEDSDLADDYVVPPYFDEDLFKVLGDARPDYRWLIIGPARSGSTFHVDPNSTSAWNAVITGAKKWIMFPPECIPPGVFPSLDGSEVTSPVSLTEWFMNYYQEIHKRGSRLAKPIECVCRAGEILFVPNGWWHCVMNLTDDCIALTQNFVTSENLVNVLDFTQGRPEQVSGFCDGDLYTRFTEALAREQPDVLEAAQKARREAAGVAGGGGLAGRLGALPGGPGASGACKRKSPAEDQAPVLSIWDRLTATGAADGSQAADTAVANDSQDQSQDETSGGFTFSFGF